QMLEADSSDIQFEHGRFLVAGTDRSVGIQDVARAAYVRTDVPVGMELGLEGKATVAPPGASFPNGCHVCEVEIDPETGVTEIVQYTVVDDVGIVINPLLLEGQIHGGVAQGVGQILTEMITYDPTDGQLLSGSFMDYGMPRAHHFPLMNVLSHSVPT